MSARTRLQKMFGNGPVETITAVMDTAGMGNGAPFNPGAPMLPADGFSKTPRSRDYQTGYNIASRPRHNERVAFTTLRDLINNYDIAQACIWHRIDSVRSLDWSLTPLPGHTGDMDADIARGMLALRKPDRETPFKAWLAKFIYDIMAYDAGALYRMRNVAGRVVGLRVIDGTTLAPMLDYWGNRPEGEAPAFVQFAQGVPWEWLTSEDIVYTPFRPQSNSPYGRAPMESVLLNANTDIRVQSYFLNRFTEGNLPAGFAESPEGWSPDQIHEYQEAWDALLYGDDAQKHQIKWVPNGTRLSWTNEKDFNDVFSLFMMRKTAAAFHVTPADLGFTEDVNKASGDTQANIQFRIGDLPLIQHLQEILSSFLQDDLGLPLQFKFDIGQEKEDRLAVAQADDIYIKAGVISASDIRERIYGLPEPDGIPVPRFIFTTRGGPIPLSALYAVSGPIDLETAAPIPGGVLPHKPFSPIEGVMPQKPSDVPPLAVVAYPAENQASVVAELVSDDAPVVKTVTAGVTVATGVFSSPMLNDDDDDDDVEVAKAAEAVVFRRFMKARLKSGVWRDFTFTTLDDSEAASLNAAGRVKLNKANGPKDPWGSHPIRKVDVALNDYHAPLVQAGLKAMLPADKIRSVIAAYLKE